MQPGSGDTPGPQQEATLEGFEGAAAQVDEPTGATVGLNDCLLVGGVEHAQLPRTGLDVRLVIAAGLLLLGAGLALRRLANGRP